jgi:hypothetical protein
MTRATKKERDAIITTEKISTMKREECKVKRNRMRKMISTRETD